MFSISVISIELMFDWANTSSDKRLQHPKGFYSTPFEKIFVELN